MNVKQEFWAVHDVVVDLPGKHDLDNDALQRLYDLLPECIRSEARKWGPNDTVVRDAVFEYLYAHPEAIETALKGKA
jgi:hypothetical protein